MAGVLGYEDEPWKGFYDKPLPVPETATGRVLGSAAKGASLGLLRSDLQPEGFVEKGAELLGSFAPIAGISAVASPFVGAGIRAAGAAIPFAAPLATRIAASPLATKTLASAATGAVAGTIGGIAEGGGVGEVAQRAGEEALMYGATEAGLIGAGRGLSKLRGLSRGEAAVADKAITGSVTTPSSTAADLATTAVPETPPVPPPPTLAKPRAPGAPPPKPVPATHLGDPETAPGGMQIARFGESTAADNLGSKAGRITLDDYISRPQASPQRLAVGLTQAASIREQLNRRFTPTMLENADTMSVEDFAKMAASNPTMSELLKQAKTTPEQFWNAAQLTKGIGDVTSKFTGGETPMFDEIFDQTIGKKVLVPRDMNVAQIVDTLKRVPEMRQVELQFDPDQLNWFKTGAGKKMLDRLDVVKQREPMLTSNVTKLSEDAANKLINEAEPISVTNMAVLEKGAEAHAISTTRDAMGIKDGELQAIVQALAKQHEGDFKGFRDSLEKALATRCAG